MVNIVTYCFLRDIHEGYLSLENADLKQSNFAIELKIRYRIKGTKTPEKKHSQKLLDHAKKSATDVSKTASNRAIQRTA